MMRFTIALVACAVVGCGGDEGDERTLESFVDPALLEQVENEVQHFCVLGNSITIERSAECGFPVSEGDWREGCFLMEPPMLDIQKEQRECFPHWAFATCDELRGSDPCALALE